MQNFIKMTAKFLLTQRKFTGANKISSNFRENKGQNPPNFAVISFSQYCTAVSTVFHKPYSSINVKVKINVSTCLEQGVTDIQMHLHEWLQQWRQVN